jgi:hypothetical protein
MAKNAITVMKCSLFTRESHSELKYNFRPVLNIAATQERINHIINLDADKTAQIN